MMSGFDGLFYFLPRDICSNAWQMRHGQQNLERDHEKNQVLYQTSIKKSQIIKVIYMFFLFKWVVSSYLCYMMCTGITV